MVEEDEDGGGVENPQLPDTDEPIQPTTLEDANGWLVGLDEQIEHASPDLLKAALEHATKLLDHMYVANDTISQKARWAIGVLFVATGVFTRLPTAKPQALTLSDYFWVNTICYIFLVMVLGTSLFCLARVVVLLSVDSHSGIAPRKADLRGTIEDTHRYALEKGATTGTNGLDYGYFVVSALQEYQFRIDKVKTANTHIGKWLNTGLILLLVGLTAWIVFYFLLNA